MKPIAAFALACAFSFMSEAGVASSPDGLPRAKPETVGFSVERLQRLTDAMHAKVDSGAMSGMEAARTGR